VYQSVISTVTSSDSNQGLTCQNTKESCRR